MVLAAVAAENDHPAVCIVSVGMLPSMSRALVGRRGPPRFVGFAVGRTIWEEPLRQYLAGTLSSEGLVDAVAENYSTLVDTFIRGSQRLTTPPG